MDGDGDLDADDHLTGKRTFDDAFDFGSQESPTPATQPMPSGGGGGAPPTPGPSPAPVGLGQDLEVTAESLMLLVNPLAASLIADNMQSGHFHRMDERASKFAAMWNALTGNQYADGAPRIPLSQTIIDGLSVAQHAIEFAAIATRRDLAGDGYDDTTGVRLWTQPRHDVLYSHPSLASKNHLSAHLAAIVNLKHILKTDVDTATSTSYQARLLYYTGLKTTFDGYVAYAQQSYDDAPTTVNLDYLNAYVEYSNYLAVATAAHIGSFALWRPVEMPDILTIAAGGGHAQHTKALERMVHYKLGMPQFFDHEQINSSSWRLVRQNPAGSTTWHPKNDNLEGVDTVYGGSSYYGSGDHNENVWSVPFNAARPGHEANATYSYPDEMFISNVAMTEWVYFPRTSLTGNYTTDTPKLVYASSHNSSPHNLRWWKRAPASEDPWISTVDHIGNDDTIVYGENNVSWNKPQNGSLVFVRLKPIPFSGSSNLG